MGTQHQGEFTARVPGARADIVHHGILGHDPTDLNAEEEDADSSDGQNEIQHDASLGEDEHSSMTNP